MSVAAQAQGNGGAGSTRPDAGRTPEPLAAFAEAYPELEASDNFQSLQSDLSETEDRIAIARRVYNDTVQTYNTLIQVFPPVLVARALGFTPREFFDAPTEAEVTPEASFVDDLNADSLDLVELIMSLEEEFGTEISDEDAEKIRTVQDAVDYIDERSA